MKLNKTDKILIFFIIVSFIASLIGIANRINAEKDSNTIDVVLDYPTTKQLSSMYGKSIYETVTALHNAGLPSIAICEDTLQELNSEGRVALYSGSSLLSSQDPSFPYLKDFLKEAEITASTTVAVTKEKNLAARIIKNLPNGSKLYHINDLYYITNPSAITTASMYGVGFDDRKIAEFKNMGLNIVLRPAFSPDNNNMEDLEDTIKKYNIKEVIFYGAPIVGYPDKLNELANFFNKNHIVTGIIETPIQKGIYKQQGLPELMKLTHYSVARVYSIYPLEQLKLTPQEIFNRWFRSIPDRNIRIIYVKPITDPVATYQENIDTNAHYIKKLVTLWSKKGINIGIPQPIKEVNLHISLLILIYLGSIALLLLYLEKLFRMKYILIWFVLLAILGGGATFISKGLMEKGTALLAATALSIVASFVLLVYLKRFYGKKVSITKLIFYSIVSSFIVFIVCIVGGIYIGASLSDTPYLLNLDMFRGVKLLYILPFFFFVLNYLYIFGVDFSDNTPKKGYYNTMEEIRKGWDIPIKAGHIVIFSVLAIALFLYLMRSGNTGISIPSIELKFRAFLEQTLIARPREKEFLVGYPSIFLAFLAAYIPKKKYLFGFLFISVMGIVSILDTFSHLRTVFLISLYRSIFGFVFGIIIGSIIILILYILIKSLKGYSK